MQPIGDEYATLLLTRWFSLVSGVQDPDVRAARVLEDLAAAGHRELIGNPMMLTIAALVSADDHGPPKGRHDLYHHFLRTLIQRRPEYRAAKLPELPVDGQLELLQALAWELQSGGRGAFARSELAEKARAAGIGSAAAEDWLDFLLGSAELLVEVEADQLNFMHREIRSYLAACSLAVRTDFVQAVQDTYM
ncbi:unnamed protein product, partial [Laminaria digitata]